MKQVNGNGRKVSVVGAGFSGLSTAYVLTKAGFKVQIFEERGEAGGLLSTLHAPFGLVETAANGILNSDRVEDLFRDVELPVTRSLKAARSRFIIRNSQPRKWPLGVGGSVGVLSFLLRRVFSRKSVKPIEGETVRAWAERVMNTEASRYLIEAALQGIYAGDPEKLSASLIFGRFFRRERRARRRVKFGTVTAPEGMGQLVAHLRKWLEENGVQFHWNQPIEALQKAPSHPVVIATACEHAAKILKSVDPEKSTLLAKIELLPILSVTANFQGSQAALEGFGCVIPPDEKFRSLGVLMNRYIFPNRVKTGYSETWILGGAREGARDLIAASDKEITDLICNEREKIFGLRGRPPYIRITRWPKALPHYTVELEKNLPVIEPSRENIFLNGNYLGQIGLARILDRAFLLTKEIHEKGQWS